VLPCAKRNSHEWTTCPFAHPNEKARRRDPRIYKYLAIPCPDTKEVRLACFEKCVDQSPAAAQLSYPKRFGGAYRSLE